jgi:hypothetical protein
MRSGAADILRPALYFTALEISMVVQFQFCGKIFFKSNSCLGAASARCNCRLLSAREAVIAASKTHYVFRQTLQTSTTV